MPLGNGFAVGRGPEFSLTAMGTDRISNCRRGPKAAPSLLACAVLMIDNGTPPAAVIALLSLNPARHLGIDAELGSIEPGKRADLTAFHPRDGYADVIQTWVDGESRFTVSDSAGVAALAH